MTDPAAFTAPGVVAGGAPRLVIVGGGQAAGAAIRRLRDLQFKGEVVLVSDEGHPPYERPPLSKEYLFGAGQEVRCIAPGARDNECVRLNSSVLSIDPAGRTVACSDHTLLPYDVLLLATGGQPRRLAIPGGELPNVHYLRSVPDAVALRRSIERCARSRLPLLVVGGSWIGLEVAAGARERGVEVVLVECGDRLCTRTLPAAEAQRLQALHAEWGVDVRLRTSLVRLAGDEIPCGAELSDGSFVEAGAVVVGIGIVPNVALAAQCGVLVRSGVVVDCQGRTSVPHIYAAGDVTEQQCNWHDAPVRIETWDNANRQGEAAASHIAWTTGQASAPVASGSLGAPPWFWSDQYGVNLQVVGAPLQGDAVLASDADGQRMAVHLRGDVVVGAVGINRPREMRQLRKLLSTGVPLTRAALLQQGIAAGLA